MSDIRFNLTPYIEDLTEIMKEIALKRYGKSIAIIVMYGSRARGDFEDDSDLEFFAVVEDGKKVDIEFTFNGMPCDMWGQTWEHLEKVANFDDHWVISAGMMSIAKIIYARTDEDRTRFESLVKDATQSGKYYEKNLQKATEFFNDIYNPLGKIQHAKRLNDIQQARGECWKIIIRATHIVAYVNSKYIKKNWGENLDEVFTFEKQPKDWQILVERLITESKFDKMLDTGSELMENLRQFMISATCDFPEESELEMLRTSDCLAYLNKIKKAGRNQNIFGAGFATHAFQSLGARDMVRLANKWNQSMKFKLYNEYKASYEEKYSDFFDAITNRDYDALIKQAESMYDTLLEYNKTKVPDFKNLEEIKKEYL